MSMLVSKFFHKFSRQIEKAQGSQKFHVLLVYSSILLDNLLLTVVVPVIPDYLIRLHLKDLICETNTLILSAQNQSYLNQSLSNNYHNNHRFDTTKHLGQINGRSVAILKNIDPTFNTENGQVGLILSSKAFVQLIFNPLVSLIINYLGYELSLIFGVAFLLNSSLLYLIGQSFLMLLLPRALQGIASALINVAGMAMIANMFRDDETRISNIGFCLGGMATGVLIGYPIGSLIYQWFGKTILFAFLLSIILLLLVTQLITFNWSPTNAPTHYDSKTLDIITNVKVVFFIVIIFISTSTMSLLESFLPIWLISEIRPAKWKLGIAFIPDSVGYLLGTNIFNLIQISLEYRWNLVIIALWIIGISAFLLPIIPNLLYLALPHFGIGFGIGAIDSALMPMLAELVDEKFAAQYGYVYTASQTASCAAYAFGPLIGGTLLNNHLLQFRSLMHLVSIANLLLGLLALFSYTNDEQKVKFQRKLSIDNDNGQEIFPLKHKPEIVPIPIPAPTTTTTRPVPPPLPPRPKPLPHQIPYERFD